MLITHTSKLFIEESVSLNLQARNLVINKSNCEVISSSECFGESTIGMLRLRSKYSSSLVISKDIISLCLVSCALSFTVQVQKGLISLLKVLIKCLWLSSNEDKGGCCRSVVKVLVRK